MVAQTLYCAFRADRLHLLSGVKGASGSQRRRSAARMPWMLWYCVMFSTLLAQCTSPHAMIQGADAGGRWAYGDWSLQRGMMSLKVKEVVYNAKLIMRRR